MPLQVWWLQGQCSCHKHPLATAEVLPTNWGVTIEGFSMPPDTCQPSNRANSLPPGCGNSLSRQKVPWGCQSLSWGRGLILPPSHTSQTQWGMPLTCLRTGCFTSACLAKSSHLIATSWHQPLAQPHHSSPSDSDPPGAPVIHPQAACLSSASLPSLHIHSEPSALVLLQLLLGVSSQETREQKWTNFLKPMVITLANFQLGPRKITHQSSLWEDPCCTLRGRL